MNRSEFALWNSRNLLG